LKVHPVSLVTQVLLEDWETKVPQEEMVRMVRTEIQDLQDPQVIEGSLVRMESRVHLDQWEKRVLLEVMDHQDFLDIKVLQENKVTLDCLDLKEQEVDQDLLDQ